MVLAALEYLLHIQSFTLLHSPYSRVTFHSVHYYYAQLTKSNYIKRKIFYDKKRNKNKALNTSRVSMFNFRYFSEVTR